MGWAVGVNKSALFLRAIGQVRDAGKLVLGETQERASNGSRFRALGRFLAAVATRHLEPVSVSITAGADALGQVRANAVAASAIFRSLFR